MSHIDDAEATRQIQNAVAAVISAARPEEPAIPLASEPRDPIRELTSEIKLLNEKFAALGRAAEAEAEADRA